MKAIRIHAWGSNDVVKLEQVELPRLQNDEVMVEVHAAGVNPIDYKVREGYFSSFMKDCFPFALGWDFSGVITEVNSTNTAFKKGDAVFGLIRFPQPAGTFAEYTTAPIIEICHKPTNINHLQAAATPLVSLTAWQGLFEYANLQSNQTILIHAAAGAVGQFAVQFAVWKGAKVIANASKASEELLKSQGVQQCIDYKSQRFDELVKAVDVVFDPIGGDNALRSLDVLKSGGKLITLLRTSQDEITQKAKAKNIDVHFMIVKPNGEQLREIAHLINDQVITAPMTKAFPLAEMKAALDCVQNGGVHGKVVIDIKTSAASL